MHGYENVKLDPLRVQYSFATVEDSGSRNVCTFQELGQFGDELGATCVTINNALDKEAVTTINRTKEG
jgi:hypothetical protein